MINKLKNYWEIFIIFLLSLTPLTWLKDNQIILGHDSGFRLNYLDHLRNLFYSWSPTSNFGVDWTIFKGFLITQAPETFFSWLFNSLATGEKISFILWFFVIGISMYVFVNSFFPQKKFWIFRLFSSSFYMYNFFLLQGWFIAERAKFSLFAALPLGLLIIYKLLNKEINLVKGTILFSFIFFFLNVGGNPTLYGSIILVYFITFIYLTFINYLKDGIKEVIYSIKTVVSLAVATFLINAYWILPQTHLIVNKYYSSLSSAGGISGIIGWESVVNQYASFINLLRLQGIPDWYNNINHPYANYFINNPLLIALSFMPILTILSGLFLYKKINIKNRNDQLFYLIFILFLVGIVFAAGSHPPLGFLYVFLIEHLPGFAVFRSAFYKFGPVYWFSFIFLAGYLLNLLLLNYVKKKYIYNFVGIFAVMLIILYHFPYFTANFFEFNKPLTTKVNIPSYVKDASAYVNKNISKESRILILPKLSPDFLADSYDWGFLSLDLLPRLSMDRSIIANDNYSSEIISNIYDAIDKKNENEFLKLTGIAGINKILWRDDAVYGNGMRASSQLHYEENTIKNFHSLRLLKEEGKWRLYDIVYAKLPTVFFIPKNINISAENNSYIGQLIAEKSTTNSALLENAKLSLSNIVSKKYVSANCVLCEHGAFKNIIGQIHGPQLRLLPNSKLYFLVKAKEYMGLLRTKGYEARALTDMIYSYKRIVEINNLLSKNDVDHNFNQEVFLNISRFKKNVNNALAEVNLLPVEKRNEFLIRIYAYLYHENRNTDSFIRNSQANSAIDDLELWIVQKMNMLEKTMWMTKDQTDKKYFIDLPSTGIYSLVFTNMDQVTPSEIYLDGRKIDIQDNRIEAGTHKLEVIYSPLESMLVKPISGELSFNILNGEKEKFILKPFSNAYLYQVSFDYRLNSGIPPNIKIVQDAVENDNRYELTRKGGNLLSVEGTWNSYEYIVSGDPNSRNFSLDFSICCRNGKNSDFTIKNLNVTQLFEPGVNFVSTNPQPEKIQVEDISYKQLDPTTYIVSVHNAATAYILSSRIGYDTGWKAFILDSSKPQNNNYLSKIIVQKGIQQNILYKANTFANAWYINKKGSYDVLIEYEPQRFFYIGGLISLVSFLLLALLFIFKGRK